MSTSISLLDNVGHLAGSVPSFKVASWQKQLRSSHLPSLEAARLHLWLGEVSLARDEQPEQAQWHFHQTEKLTAENAKNTKGKREKVAANRLMLNSLAKRDVGFALFASGRYAESSAVLNRLLKSHRAITGFDRKETALFLRHVQACAGYHAERAKIGITEPSRLDPLCGAAGLAACLRGLHLPSDEKTVKAASHITGLGSSIQDVAAAAKRLHVTPRIVAADEAGLQALPKPLIGFVEHDHFLAILKADEKGVTYLCSDCGVWPGGQRNLTWKQWRKMEATYLLTVTIPGSNDDRALSTLTTRKGTPAHVKAAGVQLAGFGGQNLDVSARLAERLLGHVVLTVPGDPVQCGGKANATHCCPQPCPIDVGGIGGGAAGGGADGAASGFAPSFGDPVNLATLEEEYAPPTDLTVYNPIGPSVTFSRIYNSLRGPDNTYESDDFGIGWSHNYNYAIYDPTVKVNARFQQGTGTATTSFTGVDAPQSGLSWDIIQGGSTIATSSSTAGWSVSVSYSGFSMTVPSGATIAQDYELRYHNTGYGSPGLSCYFDVAAASSLTQVPQGGTATVGMMGSTSPGSGLTWDVVQGGTTIATSSNPQGWNVYNGGVTAPAFAVPGNYDARIKTGTPPYTTNHSGSFAVYVVNYIPKTGTELVNINETGCRKSCPNQGFQSLGFERL